MNRKRGKGGAPASRTHGIGRPDPMAGFLAQALGTHQQGNFAEAERLYAYILDKSPQHFDALHYRGALRMQSGDYTAGMELIERALAIRPDSPDALSNLAIGLMRVKRHAEALQRLDRSLALSSRQPAAHTNRGLVLAALGRHAEAVEAYRRALQLQDTQVEAYVNLANALRALSHHDEALAACERALVLRPGYPEALNNRGLVFNAMGRFDDAIASYDQAIAQRANYAEAWSNRGNALKEAGRFDASLASYDQALALRPDYAEARYNRGNALGGQNRHREAIAEYERALALQPDHRDARWNMGLSYLLLGDLERGLPLYEERWQHKTAEARRDFACPEWTGEDLRGKRILLWAEQGLGDTLQFSRYARLLAARGAEVLLEVQPVLAGLLSRIDGVSQVIARRPDLQSALQSDSQSSSPADTHGAHFHCPLLSLPLLVQTRLDTIPDAVPYLAPEAGKLAHWQARIRAHAPDARLRVGLCCSGNPKLVNDRNRSIPLAAFMPLMHEDVALFFMQKDCRAADEAFMQATPRICDLRGELEDFEDTAAALSACDLLISVDTSVAHLAGALARPTWLLLPFAPDWRWLLERDDSPWYPGMRLYRQQRPGDWAAVMERVREALLRY